MTSDVIDIGVRPVQAADLAAISQLHAIAFGPGRFARTAYRIREATPAISPFCRLVIRSGEVIAAVRMTSIAVGSLPGAVLLGPLAVHPGYANQGFGRRLVAEALQAAAAGGEQIAILVGSTDYYGRFGFTPVARGSIILPGPVDPARLLGAELTPGALSRYRGQVSAPA